MASNKDDSNAMQQPTEVKKEKVEIDDNEPCSSSCTNTQDDMYEFINTLNYDEIASSIEIVQQLQKAIMDTNQRGSEKCIKIERQIKQEKEPEGVLIHPSLSLDNLKSEQQPCSSTYTNTQDNTDEFILALSYDEIVSSIEIVKQLWNALTDVKQTETDEECTNVEREVKQEKESEGVLSHAAVSLDSLKSEQQQSSSSGSMAESNLEKLIQELSSDELDQSIEIVKQLQKVLVNADGSESVGEFSGIHSDVKQDKKSDSVLSDPGKPLSQELKFDETDLSIEDIKQLQNFLADSDETEKQGKSSQSDQHVKEENKCQSALTDSLKFWEEQKCPSQGCSGKYNDIKLRCKEEKHLHQLSSSLIPNASSHIPGLLSSDNRPTDISCIYKNIDDIISTSKNKQNADKILNLSPVKASLDNSEASKDISKPSNVEETVDNRTRPDEYPKCGSLKLQMRTRKSNRFFSCKTCGANFTESYKLKVHMRIHTGERPFECKFCGAKFTQSSHLKLHMRIHTGERPFECKSCEAKFIGSTSLKRHMRTHTGERPFDCKTCGAKFTRAGVLKVHMRTHTGERPFGCKSCGAKFSRSDNLKLHMSTHTGERPFGCKSCGAKFIRAGDLKVHIRTHTGEKPFACKSCGSKFIRAGDLKVHKRTHTGERPFACKSCGAKFTKSGNLKVHMRTHT